MKRISLIRKSNIVLEVEIGSGFISFYGMSTNNWTQSSRSRSESASKLFCSIFSSCWSSSISICRNLTIDLFCNQLIIWFIFNIRHIFFHFLVLTIAQRGAGWNWEGTEFSVPEVVSEVVADVYGSIGSRVVSRKIWRRIGDRIPEAVVCSFPMKRLGEQDFRVLSSVLVDLDALVLELLPWEAGGIRRAWLLSMRKQKEWYIVERRYWCIWSNWYWGHSRFLCLLFLSGITLQYRR